MEAFLIEGVPSPRRFRAEEVPRRRGSAPESPHALVTCGYMVFTGVGAMVIAQ
jgi:hypothetical protein